ncbi:MAG: hypothetical protein OEV64_02855 [Desulfobulbaceae bacterium]|nr:hypothetical protein [Desulfobulbaceae bacterium]
MKVTGIIILLFVLSVGGLTAYVLIFESESNYFQDYESLVSSGLIDKGWVPKFIPKSSYDIKEHHRVDVPHIYVELNFTESDLASFEQACKKMKKAVYQCHNEGYPVEVTITDGNHAIIKSI